MYKEKVCIKTYDNELKTVNIETIGERISCYSYHYRCENCKNESIVDGGGTVYACKNCKIFADVENEKLYCENYYVEKEK